MQKRYHTREGHILHVPLGGGVTQVVTDAVDGVALPDTPSVREHVRLGRLFEVKPEKRKKEEANA